MERTDTDAARRFGRDLAAIVAIGITLRVAAALWLDAHSPPKGDAVWYLEVALWHPNRVADETLELDAVGLVPLVTVAVLQYWAYVVAGAIGLCWLRRRGKPVVPVVAPIGVALVVSVAAYGALRFRIALDAVLPILVGIGAIAFVDWRRAPGSARAERRASPGSAVSGGQDVMTTDAAGRI
jgi:hypothetical protein